MLSVTLVFSSSTRTLVSKTKESGLIPLRPANKLIMAYKKDTRQRVKVLNCNIPYLKGMVGRVEEINGDIYNVMVGPIVVALHKSKIQILD